MIVVEGADCVGKTTFCHRLIAELRESDPSFSMVYQHLSKMHHSTDGALVHLSMLGPAQVRDRFHMSEVVYARELDRPSIMDPVTYEVIDARIALMGGMVVVLTAADEVISRRYEKRVADHGKGSEMFPLSTVLSINERFKAIGQLRHAAAEPLDEGMTRWRESDYRDHGVPFRVDAVVHQTFTHPEETFERGLREVAQKYVERQCAFFSRFFRRQDRSVDLSRWPH